MCDVEFDTYWSTCSERKVTARKMHVCDCCHGVIRPGEIYVKHFSVTEGDVTSEKTCSACWDMTAAFAADHGTHSNPSSMPALLDTCIETERDEGNDAMADKWQAAVDAMRDRRTIHEQAPE